MTPRVTIAIGTRNRPASLNACLRSLDVLRPLPFEVIVFDDGSSPPAADQIAREIPRPRIIRHERSTGNVVGRNRLVREAAAPLVLLLDDDTQILSRESVEHAIEVLDRDPRVAGVAFSQCEADGRPWPARMQPSTALVPSVVASFIGYAHLVRRDVFLAIGGYREELVRTGEEKDFCLRLLDAGYLVVYLPSAGVAHTSDPAGRDRPRYVRVLVRNDCVIALHNDPFPRVLWTVPARLALYFRMRAAWGIHDPWGWLWVLRDLLPRVVPIVRSRRPVSRETLKRWRVLRRTPPPYALPSPASVREEHA